MAAAMTCSAGELVNQLRVLDPSTPVYVTATSDDLETIKRLRSGWFHRRARVLRSIASARVIVTDNDRFAYIESGEKL